MGFSDSMTQAAKINGEYLQEKAKEYYKILLIGKYKNM